MFNELNHVLPEIRKYPDAFPIGEDELQKKMRAQEESGHLHCTGCAHKIIKRMKWRKRKKS